MNVWHQTVKFDASLLNKYDRPLPRYTSYPPATEFDDSFLKSNLQAEMATSNAQKTPLSLYCHIPFCESACYFCGCNTVITQHREVVEPYLHALARNIQQVAEQVDRDRLVQQLHWGGGTPNYLSEHEVEQLWTALQDRFQFAEDAEISIEVNPRSLTKEYLANLKNLGFNRISFGIQDFHPQVQQAVNRIQPEAMLFQVMDWMREVGFTSINVDLIYGLPYQTLDTFQKTIYKTLQLDPDRIAVFNFAYVPWLKPTQRWISPEALPIAAEKLQILQMTIEELTANGYIFIGMDHFAKPNDELAIAQQQGQLHRNFQGYTIKPESDLLGFGVTSISMLDTVYVQNQRRLRPFYQAVEQGKWPIEKGITLHREDKIRRAVIMELMCQFRISQAEFTRKYALDFELDFAQYFAEEHFQLRCLEADGLLNILPDGLEVTPAGRLLIRNIAAVFDTYLQQHQLDKFSQAV